MSACEPLVCHRCWPTRANWFEPCSHVKEMIDRVYIGRPVSALENELDSRSDECFELRQDVKRLEEEANELRAKLARTTHNVAALVDAARRLLNGGDCTCDPAPKGARVDVCATCEMRAALGALR